MEIEIIYQEFGNCLKKARKSAELTQGALADLVGLNRTSITNMENGRQHVSLHVLFRLANALGIHVYDLLPDLGHISEIEKIDSRLLEEAGLGSDVRSWVGKVLSFKEKKEAEHE